MNFFLLLWVVVGLVLVSTAMAFELGRDDEEEFHILIAAALWPIAITILMICGVILMVKDVFSNADIR